LPLAEATVFRFLTPIVTAWACSIFLGLVFTKKELAAGLMALVGVVFIAHPKSIFGPVGDHAHAMEARPIDEVSSAHRVIAVAVALVGVIGQSGAYTMIRVIGILFALSFDWAIWGVLPGMWSLFGGFIIIASTLWSALQKSEGLPVKTPKTVADEERALLGAQREDEEGATHTVR
jgi:drug/metabolite transporter (DMT)-like permease